MADGGTGLQAWRVFASRVWIALALSLLLAAASCTPGPTPAADGEIDQITWALPEIPDTLFVPYSWTTFEGAIMALVQEGLLAFDDDLSLTEAVASSWEQPDPTTYVYTIREGITFHDGSPVTAEDVATTMRWHTQEQSGSQLGAFYASVASIEATGEREVTVTLDAPDVQWQYTPAHMAGFIMKASQLEGDLEALGSPDLLPLGTGPYMVTEFAPGEEVVLERYEGYWGNPAPAARIVITAIPDAQTRLLAMQNGDIDGTFDIPIPELEQWEQLEDVDVVTAPSNGVVLLTMDFETPPFDDVHVRRAIAHALDRDGLVTGVLGGRGEAATALNPPGMWAGVLSPDEARAFYETLPQYEFDLDQAAAELAQSSVPDGFEFSVSVPAELPGSLNALLSLSENLSQIGVTLNVEQVDIGTWLDVYFAHEEGLGMQAMEYFPDFADPANYPLLFLHSDSATVDGLNASNYRNPRVDELINTALENSDPAVREEALKEMFQMTTEELAVLPVLYPDSAMAISSRYRLDGYSAFWYNIPWANRGFGTK